MGKAYLNILSWYFQEGTEINHGKIFNTAGISAEIRIGCLEECEMHTNFLSTSMNVRDYLGRMNVGGWTLVRNRS